MPLLDQGVSALIEDLHQRGLDQDVSVVVWGEFGRTPKINKDAGRDHWPQVSLRPAGRRRHAHRPGDRLDEPARRVTPMDRPVHVRRSLRHALSQPGHRREHRDDPRPLRPPAISGRPCGADARIGVTANDAGFC